MFLHVYVFIIIGNVHTLTDVTLLDFGKHWQPGFGDENAHRKRINSKTLSKVDKFENAVYASSCGRP